MRGRRQGRGRGSTSIKIHIFNTISIHLSYVEIFLHLEDVCLGNSVGGAVDAGWGLVLLFGWVL